MLLIKGATALLLLVVGVDGLLPSHPYLRGAASSPRAVLLACSSVAAEAAAARLASEEARETLARAEAAAAVAAEAAAKAAKAEAYAIQAEAEAAKAAAEAAKAEAEEIARAKAVAKATLEAAAKKEAAKKEAKAAAKAAAKDSVVTVAAAGVVTTEVTVGLMGRLLKTSAQFAGKQALSAVEAIGEGGKEAVEKRTRKAKEMAKLVDEEHERRLSSGESIALLATAATAVAVRAR